jgi:hypothetical protein
MTHERATWFQIFWAVVMHPHLWSTALRQVVRAIPARWWQRPPFLPVPSAAYVRYRLETAYGDLSGAPDPGDVVRYLEWCRRRDRARRVNG